MYTYRIAMYLIYPMPRPCTLYTNLLPVAMVLLGLLCRINKLLHCGQGAGICIGCEYQVLIGKYNRIPCG